MTTLTQTTYHYPRVGMLATVRNRRCIISSVEPFPADDVPKHLPMAQP